MLILVILALLAIQPTQPNALSDATQLVVSTSQTIVEVDSGKLKGDLARLAWSPDGSDIYIQTVERGRSGDIRSVRHYVVSGLAKPVKGLDQEPTWVAKYWAWKSGQASPGAATFKIAADIREDVVRSTAAPAGGALAKGGGADPLTGSTVEDLASAANQTQKKTTYSLKLKGEVIGEWINEAMIPGVNWTWAPAPHRLIAFAKREGGPLVLLDDSGRKQELGVARLAILPAWSGSGNRIAWLERKDKKKYDLVVAEVSAR
jgi:hypothetical protein